MQKISKAIATSRALETFLKARRKKNFKNIDVKWIQIENWQLMLYNEDDLPCATLYATWENGRTDFNELHAVQIHQTKELVLTWEEFMSEFQPIENHFETDGTFDNRLFHPFGHQQSFALKNEYVFFNMVWTLIDDGETQVIKNGIHPIDCSGFFVTDRPYIKSIDYSVEVNNE